jgi:hypothetical protein
VKKPSRKTLVKACDREMSLFVRERDRKCVLCGSHNNLQCGHLLSRVAYSTRWDFANCFCQCAGCNLRHEYDASTFTLWYIKKYGLKLYEDLVYKHNHTQKFTNSDLKILLALIQGKREGLKL